MAPPQENSVIIADVDSLFCHCTLTPIIPWELHSSHLLFFIEEAEAQKGLGLDHSTQWWSLDLAQSLFLC